MPTRGRLLSDPIEVAKLQAARDRKNRYTAQQREARDPKAQPSRRGRKPKVVHQPALPTSPSPEPVYESIEIPPSSTLNDTIRVASWTQRQERDTIESDTIRVAFRPRL